MKITKQTAYRHTVAQRAMRMEEIVAWVKDERTRDKLALFREKLRRAYPDKRYPFTRKLPPRDLPDPGIQPASPALAGGFFTIEPLGKPCMLFTFAFEW